MQNNCFKQYIVPDIDIDKLSELGCSTTCTYYVQDFSKIFQLRICAVAKCQLFLHHDDHFCKNANTQRTVYFIPVRFWKKLLCQLLAPLETAFTWLHFTGKQYTPKNCILIVAKLKLSNETVIHWVAGLKTGFKLWDVWNGKLLFAGREKFGNICFFI